MRYAVILSYSGHVQHFWIYDSQDHFFALKQFTRLTEAFQEVNECQVFMFKIGSIIDKCRLSEIIKDLYVSL